MLFSVIIATYDRAKFIEATLESVRAQEFKDYETIVVDDGSTDETMSLLQEHPWVRVLRQKNKGSGAARNYGASQARGEYIAFLDSDDIWFPWTLATYATVIHDYNDPAIVSAGLVEFSDQSEVPLIKEDRLRVDDYLDYLSASRAGYFVGAGMSVLKRDEFLRVGGYIHRRTNAEDHDLILRLGLAPGFVRILRPITLAWRRHAQSATADLARSVEGSSWLIEQERRGNYPGGALRIGERRRNILQHVCPVALECLRKNMRRDAWELYRATFCWHIALRRWKFLIGFPVRACVARQ
jgi:glycosyltransferase involved in cell wall biosynthesis